METSREKRMEFIISMYYVKEMIKVDDENKCLTQPHVCQKKFERCFKRTFIERSKGQRRQ